MGLGITISVNGKGDAALADASRVEIFECMGETTFYTLTYPEDIEDGDMNFIKDSRLDPGSVITVSAEVNDEMMYLVKGPVYSQKIYLLHGGQGSVLEVRGGDTTINMDAEFKSSLWADVTDGEVVSNILNKYSLTPDVMKTETKHIENKHSLVQNETDLRLIKRLARRNGCYFWITCDSSGKTETAHFQRPKLDSSPAAELILNFENSNIGYLNINWDTERPASISSKELDLNTKNVLDGSVSKTPQTLLGSKGLKDVTKNVHSLQMASAVDDAGDLKARSEAALIESDWFIRASCSTSLHQLGKLVRTHTVVNVKGAGSRHSGKYYVYSVHHIIDAAAHVMEIELIRNGWNENQGGTDQAPKIF